MKLIRTVDDYRMGKYGCYVSSQQEGSVWILFNKLDCRSGHVLSLQGWLAHYQPHLESGCGDSGLFHVAGQRALSGVLVHPRYLGTTFIRASAS